MGYSTHNRPYAEEQVQKQTENPAEGTEEVHPEEKTLEASTEKQLPCDSSAEETEGPAEEGEKDKETSEEEASSECEPETAEEIPPEEEVNENA